MDVGPYALARWLMNTVAPLLIARIAFAWIWVLGGRTPFANRVMIDLGRLRSLCGSPVSVKSCYRWPFARGSLGVGMFLAIPQSLSHPCYHSLCPPPCPCPSSPPRMALAARRSGRAALWRRALLGREPLLRHSSRQCHQPRPPSRRRRRSCAPVLCRFCAAAWWLSGSSAGEKRSRKSREVLKQTEESLGV